MIDLFGNHIIVQPGKENRIYRDKDSDGNAAYPGSC